MNYSVKECVIYMCMRMFYHQISELNGESILKEQSVSALKKITDILVIDDNPFTFLEALRKHEFNIEQKDDLHSLKDVEAYDIILCDVRGVGKFLESKYEGAYLIKQIKEKYPNKSIVAYTANEYDPDFQTYLSYADAIIQKGCALEDWSSLLDKIVKESADPIKQWQKTRSALLESGVSTIDVAKYESQYVKVVKSGDFESLKKTYENKPTNKGVEIMLSLLTSLVGKYIKE